MPDALPPVPLLARQGEGILSGRGDLGRAGEEEKQEEEGIDAGTRGRSARWAKRLSRQRDAGVRGDDLGGRAHPHVDATIVVALAKARQDVGVADLAHAAVGKDALEAVSGQPVHAAVLDRDH